MDYFNLYKYLPEYYEMVVMGSRAALEQMEYVDVLKIALPMKTQAFINNIELLETTMMRRRKNAARCLRTVQGKNASLLTVLKVC